jgi:hypothetical protein
MNSGPPKANTLPIKPILLIVLAAGVAIWFISQRNNSSNRTAPRTSSNNSLSNSLSNGATSASAPGDQNERVEKYPMLASPDQEPPDKEFPVQVSLTEDQNPDVVIKSGNKTADGKLVFTLPATQEDSWKLDVALSAPGMIFTHGGTGIGSIDLPRHGDATPAVFFIKAGPKAAANGVVHLLATFVYKDSFLASIGRDVQITSAAPDPNAPTASKPTMKMGVALANSPFSNQVPAPDLTLFIKGDAVQIYSPTFGLATGTLKDMTGFSDWVAKQSPANAGRGSELVANEGTWRRAEGFGELLYRNYAPDVFKKVFWALDRTRGKNFRTIQIFSDKPDIPWELMRPVSEDGRDQRNFLGLDYSVARWDTDDGVLMERPPYIETVAKMFVIAPQYSGNLSLDGQTKETQALAQLNGYEAVKGNTNALKTLFQNPPQGIVHFAGHGQLDEAHDEFEILLEDGTLDTSTWRSMAPADPLGHTFFFFNACDVGQSKHTGNFVDGFGPAVLSKGASGYIGALWPVNDKVAADFSVEFYQLLQQEMQAGPANVSATLERTRRDVYEKTKNPTALAYVLYGDTNLNFVK